MTEVEEESVYLQAMLRFAVTCSPCELREGVGVPADWIVSSDEWPPENAVDFLCDGCLQRWRGFGFGVVYGRGARWERL